MFRLQIIQVRIVGRVAEQTLAPLYEQFGPTPPRCCTSCGLRCQRLQRNPGQARIQAEREAAAAAAVTPTSQITAHTCRNRRWMSGDDEGGETAEERAIRLG
jgi:hypothetical protein